MNQFKNKYKLPGLSLVEVLLSVALLAILAMVMLPVSMSMLQQNEMDSSVVALAGSLRNAQANAQAGRGDTTWGVKLTGGQIIIFKGALYSSRDANFDAVNVLSNKISVSGTNEVIFSKIEGLASFPGTPSTPGVITFTLADKSSNITINARGGLTY